MKIKIFIGISGRIWLTQICRMLLTWNDCEECWAIVEAPPGVCDKTDVHAGLTSGHATQYELAEVLHVLANGDVQGGVDQAVLVFSNGYHLAGVVSRVSRL